MARKLRIAAVGTLTVTALLVTILAGAYYAARQVRPFYEQALRVEPEALVRGSRELECRATALYSDAQQQGQWQALFTTEQINGWLATQLALNQDGELPTDIRDPRVAIARDVLTLGFRTSSGGVETVVSVDASVSLTEEGAVAIQFLSVRAGALPLPVMQLADEIAAACLELELPVRWTRTDGKPVAIVEIHSESLSDEHEFYIDSIELGENELYVAGHTELSNGTGLGSPKTARRRPMGKKQIALDDYELRLTPTDDRSALEIARRDRAGATKGASASGR